MASFEIEIREPDQDPRRLPLRAGLTIGRHDDNDCVVTDAKVSGFHARIDAAGDDFAVVDLGSSNGTHVKDGPSLKAQESHPLGAGSRFMVGFTEFEIFEVAAAKPAVEPTRMFSIVDEQTDAPVEEKVDEVVAEKADETPDSEAATTSAEVTLEAERASRAEERAHRDDFTTASKEIIAPPDRSLERISDAPSKGVPVAPVSDLAPIVGQETTAEEEFPEFGGSGVARKPDEKVAPRDDLEDLSEGRTEGFQRVDLHRPPPSGDGPDPDEETILSPPDRSLGAAGREPTPEPEPDLDRRPPIDASAATMLTPKPDLVGHVAEGLDDESTLITSPEIDKADQGLEFMRPRLVVVTPSERHLAPIDRREFLLGRKHSKGGQIADCAIDSPTISSRHATITFRHGQFFIEDQGSSNGTFVRGEKLEKGSTREIKADEQVVLGATDLLLLLDRDSQYNDLPRGPYRDALEYLVRKRKIDRETADSLWQRCAVDGEHPAEALIIQSKIQVPDWCAALAAGSKTEARANRSNAIFFALIAIALGAVVAYLLLLR